MNILIAPDKFKDAATAFDICKSLEDGIKATFPEANCFLLPLADGGEGTLESISKVFNAEWQYLNVCDPLFRNVKSGYLLIPQKNMAVIEVARASGIELLKPLERNCLKTTTFGTGQLILDALNKGVTEIILTVGGTATNDAGIGVAEALGFHFFDDKNTQLKPIGENLIKVQRISTDKVDSKIRDVKFTIATDVENPFYGTLGAAHTFAKQKGAVSEAISALDAGLLNMARLLETHSGNNPQKMKGSGAGGGLAGGLACLLGAQIISAAEWILELNNVASLLDKSEVLITGEGKVDAQTWGGKLISRLLSMAKEAKVPVIVICGTLEDIDILAKQDNIIYAKSILNQPTTLQDAIANTLPLVKQQGVLLGKFLPIL